MNSALKRLTDPFREHGTKPAVLGRGFTWTYQDLERRIASISAGLRARGLKDGDRVAVSLPNGADFLACYFAVMVSGMTIIPINPALSKNDLDYILEVCRPQLVLKAEDQIPMGEGETVSEAFDDQKTGAIFFTSGTTNRPKGVCHCFASMVTNAAAFNQMTGLDAACRMLHVMPMGYMAGFLNTVLCPLLAGGTVILGEPFSAESAVRFWDPCRRHQVNALWLSPTMAAFLSRLQRDPSVPEWTGAHLRHVFVGTAPLPMSVKESFESTFGVECLESYGMTEVMLISSNTFRQPCKPGSVGPMLDGVCMEQRGDAQGDATSGRALFVCSEYALKGYLDPVTGEPISPLEDGWLATGDVGRVDAEGNVFITGRIKDLIIHGGTNVSPRAVEEVLLGHDLVRDAAVIGVPHAFWGEEVTAFIVPEPGREVDAATIKNFCRSALPPDAVPGRIHFTGEFPRTQTGKVKRNELERLL